MKFLFFFLLNNRWTPYIMVPEPLHKGASQYSTAQQTRYQSHHHTIYSKAIFNSTAQQSTSNSLLESTSYHMVLYLFRVCCCNILLLSINVYLYGGRRLALLFVFPFLFLPTNRNLSLFLFEYGIVSFYQTPTFVLSVFCPIYSLLFYSTVLESIQNPIDYLSRQITLYRGRLTPRR